MAQYVMLSMYDIIHALNYFIFIKLKKSITKLNDIKKKCVLLFCKLIANQNIIVEYDFNAIPMLLV